MPCTPAQIPAPDLLRLEDEPWWLAPCLIASGMAYSATTHVLAWYCTSIRL